MFDVLCNNNEICTILIKMLRFYARTRSDVGVRWRPKTHCLGDAFEFTKVVYGLYFWLSPVRRKR